MQRKPANSSKRTSRRGFLQSAGAGAAAAVGPTILGAANKSGSFRPVVGGRFFKFEVIHDWGELPGNIKYGNTHGVKVDSQGFVYVHHTVHENSESLDSVVVFDPDGKFVKSWGAEFAGGAHGLHLTKEGGGEFLYFCDIRRDIVKKTTLDGEEVFTLGYPAESEAYTGPDKVKWKPTNLAVAPNGDIYVGDGYGSSYIVQYNKDGEYIRTFGGPGEEPGKLKVPHGIICDTRGEQPLILVADRSNRRLQYFTLDGAHLKFEHNVDLPCHFDIYKTGEMVIPDLARRVTVFDKHNNPVAHLGEGLDDWFQRRQKTREAFIPGKFVCPHGACYDHDGNIFVVEWVEVGRVTKMRRLA